MHDIMSDMKTFTVRDLDRQPTKVLKACDVEGAVRIKSRNGRTYTIRADNGGQRIRSLPDFAAGSAIQFKVRSMLVLRAS